MRLAIYCISGILFFNNVYSSEFSGTLEKATINLKDEASLQRGARIFFNYCAGCHTMKYMRYNALAKGIGLVDENGKLLESVLKENLIFTGETIYEPILNSLQKQDAKQWFGILPPDLTLVTRARGRDWVYTYLLSFYQDKKRPFGVNNLVFADTAMPNVLEDLQGIQIPIYAKKTGSEIPKVAHLALLKEGIMDPAHFKSQVNDLVNFLSYAGEPQKIKRQRLGIFVLLFMLALCVFAYLLKKEYWKDIH